MGVDDGRASLARALLDLRMRWQEARSGWDDDAARRFEERLAAMESDVKVALTAMDTLASLLREVHRECE